MHNDGRHSSSFRSWHINVPEVAIHFFGLWKTLRKGELYFETKARAELHTVTGDTGVPSKAGLIRIRKYWELSLHFICRTFYSSNGWVLSREEEERILLLSLLSPFYDDLFDEGVEENRIKALTEDPDGFVPVLPNEKIVHRLYCSLLGGLKNQAAFKEQFLQVFYWQKRSLLQKEQNISAAALYEIMTEKSYHSFLLFYRLLDRFPSVEELNMIHRVAKLLQFTNDVFDVYKDVHQQVYTIPNLYGNYTKLRLWLLDEVALLNRQIALLLYPSAGKKKLVITFHAMNAICLMALEQLERNTGGKADFVALQAMSRKELVCDMDGFSARIKWLWKVRTLCGVG